MKLHTPVLNPTHKWNLGKFSLPDAQVGERDRNGLLGERVGPMAGGLGPGDRRFAGIFPRCELVSQLEGRSPSHLMLTLTTS
jgi:hypothetical protein